MLVVLPAEYCMPSETYFCDPDIKCCQSQAVVVYSAQQPVTVRALCFANKFQQWDLKQPSNLVLSLARATGQLSEMAARNQNQHAKGMALHHSGV